MNDKLTLEEATKPVLPSGLNVLTILTLIGSAFAIFFMAAYPWIVDFSLSMIDKAASTGQDISAKQMADMEKGRQALELAKANMVPLVITGILGGVLCIVGAVMMRKLKKDGYWVYIVGEIVPVIASFILLGASQLTGMNIFLSLIIPVLFIALYTMQKKHLVH